MTNSLGLRTILASILVLLFLPLSLAQTPEPPLFPDNDTPVVSQDDPLYPFLQTVTPIIRKVSLVMGGIFGLYMVLILVRIYYERKHVRLLQDIRYDLDQINRKFHLPTSHSQRTGWERIMDAILHQKR